MKAKIIKDRCKFCGKDTSHLDFMVTEVDTGDSYDVCVECLIKANQKPLKGDE